MVIACLYWVDTVPDGPYLSFTHARNMQICHAIKFALESAPRNTQCNAVYQSLSAIFGSEPVITPFHLALNNKFKFNCQLFSLLCKCNAMTELSQPARLLLWFPLGSTYKTNVMKFQENWVTAKIIQNRTYIKSVAVTWLIEFLPSDPAARVWFPAGSGILTSVLEPGVCPLRSILWCLCYDPVIVLNTDTGRFVLMYV